MNGILRIAFKLLVNDKGKFAALLVGIIFAVFLMVMMTSMFAGILARSSATVVNIGAKMWVMDPAVNIVASSIPMPDYVIDAVRSINGVNHAVPLYSGSALVKLRDGTYQGVSVIGLDDSTLIGVPTLYTTYNRAITCIPATRWSSAIRDVGVKPLPVQWDRHAIFHAPCNISIPDPSS